MIRQNGGLNLIYWIDNPFDSKAMFRITDKMTILRYSTNKIARTLCTAKYINNLIIQ